MTREAHDLTGKQFGDLTVIELNGKTNNGSNKWLCKCICGNMTKEFKEHISKIYNIFEGNKYD